MIVQVPFTYDFTYIPKGKRNSVEIRVKDTCEVLIEEIGKDEAPVVLTMPSRDQRSVENRIHVEYRHYRDQLWHQRVFHTTSRGTEKIAMLEDVLPLVAGKQEVYGLSRFWQTDSWRDNGALETVTGLAIREIVLDGRDKRIEEIRKAAADSISIDGVMFQVTPEPIVRIYYTHDYPHLELSQYAGIPVNPDYYRIDRILELQSKAEERFGKEVTYFRDHEVEVFRPDLIFFDDEANALEQAMGRFVEALPSRLREGSKEFLCAYVDVRETWMANRHGEATMDKVAQAVETAATCMVRDGNGLDTAERAIEALDRWHAARGHDDAALLATAFGTSP